METLVRNVDRRIIKAKSTVDIDPASVEEVEDLRDDQRV